MYKKEIDMHEKKDQSHITDKFSFSVFLKVTLNHMGKIHRNAPVRKSDLGIYKRNGDILRVHD